MSNSITVSTNQDKVVRQLRGIEESKAREFFELLQRAYKPKPDPKDIRELRKWMEKHPELWRAVFDLAHVMKENFIGRMVSEQAARLAIEKNIEEMHLDLGYEAAPAMEKLLIDNIVISWLRCQWTEYQLIVFMGEGQVRMSVVEFWERRLSASQRRYLMACETLAKIRRLSAKNPAFQLNIATRSGQQVNVAGDVTVK